MTRRETIEGFIIGIIRKDVGQVLYDASMDQWVTANGCDADECGLVDMPETPGVYRCSLEFWDEPPIPEYDPEIELRVINTECLVVFPPLNFPPGYVFEPTGMEAFTE